MKRERKPKRVVHTVVAIASHEKSNATAMAVVQNWECKAGRRTAFWIEGCKTLPQHPWGMKVQICTEKWLADHSVAREKEQRCKWKALGIAQVADSSDRGCSRAINPLWPSREAADFCSQGETWGPFPNPDAWALREDFPTTSPLSACHPSHPPWLLENHSCSYILPKRHLYFAPYLVGDLFMVVCAQNFVTKELFHLKMPLPSSVSCDGSKTRAHVLQSLLLFIS